MYAKQSARYDATRPMSQAGQFYIREEPWLVPALGAVPWRPLCDGWLPENASGAEPGSNRARPV
jgi:hypothetical protein